MTAVAACLLALPVAAGPARAQAAEASGLVPVGAGARIEPPQGWQVTRDGALVRFTPPERDLTVTVVPVTRAANAAEAVAQAWRRAGPAFRWPVRLAQPLPARDGWNEAVATSYDVPPAEKAIAQAIALRHGSAWTVVTLDGATATIATIAERGGQFAASSETLRPAGYVKESFAGRAAHPMDAARIEALRQFVRTAMAGLKVPGVGLAIVDHDRIVYESGLGLRDVATGAPVDGDTLFMVASNTKGMATLLLATLVAQGRRLEQAGRRLHAGPPRQRGNDAAGAGEASGLRLHRPAAQGPAMAVQHQARHRPRGDLRPARRDAADQRLRRGLPV